MLDVRFRRNRYTAVRAWKKWWWHWGGCGASVCRCISPNGDTSFMQCFEEVKYEKSLGEHVAERREWAMSEVPPGTKLVQICGLFQSFHLWFNSTYLECECHSENRKRLGACFFVGLHKVEIYSLSDTVHATFYLGRPPWGPEYYSCSVLMVPTLPVFSHYSDLDIRHQPKKGFAWIIAVMKVTVLSVFRFLCACHNGIVLFTCHEDRTSRSRQGTLVPFGLKVR